jgi:hypothetical protein
MTTGTDFDWAAWFERMASSVSSDPELLKSLGFADFRLLVAIEDEGAARRFGIVLDGYDVFSAGEVADADAGAFAPDVTLAGPLSAWLEMAENIEEFGRADRAHTLNTLSIADTPLRLVGDDPLGRDKFFRYAATLQALFDAAGHTSGAVH